MKQSGQLIEQLSLGVYDAVRRLLGRLRPRQLDDLTLRQAIRVEGDTLPSSKGVL